MVCYINLYNGYGTILVTTLLRVFKNWVEKKMFKKLSSSLLNEPYFALARELINKIQIHLRFWSHTSKVVSNVSGIQNWLLKLSVLIESHLPWILDLFWFAKHLGNFENRAFMTDCFRPLGFWLLSKVWRIEVNKKDIHVNHYLFASRIF